MSSSISFLQLYLEYPACLLPNLMSFFLVVCNDPLQPISAVLVCMGMCLSARAWAAYSGQRLPSPVSIFPTWIGVLGTWLSLMLDFWLAQSCTPSFPSLHIFMTDSPISFISAQISLIEGDNSRCSWVLECTTMVRKVLKIYRHCSLSSEELGGETVLLKKPCTLVAGYATSLLTLFHNAGRCNAIFHGRKDINDFIQHWSLCATISIFQAGCARWHNNVVLAGFMSTWLKPESSERREPQMRKCLLRSGSRQVCRYFLN